jgi:hypothetical protein
MNPLEGLWAVSLSAAQISGHQSKKSLEVYPDLSLDIIGKTLPGSGKSLDLWHATLPLGTGTLGRGLVVMAGRRRSSVVRSD